MNHLHFVCKIGRKSGGVAPALTGSLNRQGPRERPSARTTGLHSWTVRLRISRPLPPLCGLGSESFTVKPYDQG